MHEQAIAQAIIKEAEKHGKVKSMTLEVGDLAHLSAQETEEVLKQMTDWDIMITQKRATVKCECGYEGEPEIVERGHDHLIFKCPECGDMMPKIIDGKDIKIVEVEVE